MVDGAAHVAIAGCGGKRNDNQVVKRNALLYQCNSKFSIVVETIIHAEQETQDLASSEVYELKDMNEKQICSQLNLSLYE